MAQLFRLFWLREAGCDAGTLVRADELDGKIRERVLALANDHDEFTLKLPFFDRREWRKRGDILSALQFERRGNQIACVLEPSAAMRDLGATLALTHPAWTGAPGECDARHFPVWQRVSLALQKSLRTWIASEYFQDAGRYQDREAAYPMLVYEVTRLHYGRPRTEFTYDLRDYPDCQSTLASAWKTIGRSLQTVMANAERRLHDAGMHVLARRYAPVWHQDVLVAVRKKPKQFVDLLARESEFINALIDLGTSRDVPAVNRFSRFANQALRKAYGMDVRKLGVLALEEATRVLESQVEPRGSEDDLPGGMVEDCDMRSSGRPDTRIG